MRLGIYTKNETIEAWKKEIHERIGEKSGLFGLSGIKIKEAEMMLGDNETVAVCLGYKAKFNNGNFVQDCFFFQGDKLIALRLVLDQQECYERCMIYNNTVKHVVSLGFELSSKLDSDNFYFRNYKYGNIDFNAVTWGIHTYLDHENKDIVGVSAVRMSQYGCVSIHPASLASLISEHSESNGPNLICTFE